MRKTILSLCAAISCAAVADAGDFTHNLLCRWTFNGNEPGSALVDDISGVTLHKSGIGGDQEFTLKDGKLLLGNGTLLTAPEINGGNEKFSGLGERITIWMRFRLLSSSKDSFLIGLLNADKFADWAEQTLSIHLAANSIPRIFGTNTEGKHFSRGLNDPLVTGTFAVMAFRFDKGNSSFSLSVNDKHLSAKDKNTTGLGSFRCFAVGRLKIHAGVRMEIDEIRIYKAVIPHEWLAEIEAVE